MQLTVAFWKLLYSYKNEEIAAGIIEQKKDFDNSGDTKTVSGTKYDLVWKDLEEYVDEAVANEKINYTYREIKQDKLSYDELKKVAKLSQLPINKLFNTSGNVYKQNNLKDKLKDMTDEDKLNLLASEAMLVKRPVLIADDFALVGFNEDLWNQKLEGK